MATTGQQVEPNRPPAAGSLVEYEEFIESQLRKTRSRVRAVDIAAAILVLLVGSLGFVLLAALLDHWVIPGGLGFWGRLTMLTAFVAGAGWWTVSTILPLLFKRINPLYAAHTIERSKPSLKNSLVNFLLFRSEPAGIHQRVFEQIEQQAATSLAGVPVESAVDRSRLIRLGYVLIAVLAICALYALLSPKNLFQTVGRVVMPWADITPPTSTTIDEIEPGTTQAFRGQQVTVKARVQGLPDDGKVLLYYTTADRQIVDRPIEMSRPADDYRHAAVLPDGDASLQQTLTYRITAGDATSRNYTIEVVAAPTIVVEAVQYKYPDYTGLVAQRIEHQGDLKGIEGTEVTLEALANQPITQGYVDFDANHTLDLPLQADASKAKVTFKLSLREDRQGPEHTSYQLVFKNASGQENLQPVRHQIEVTPDQPPVIQLVSPERQEIDLALDDSIDLEIVASDPDFALADVKLTLAKGARPVDEVDLLAENWRGQFVKKYRFVPSEHKLAAGDIVEYFAQAVDNKSPRPNQSETPRRRIRIMSPEGQSGGGDQLAGREPAQDASTSQDADPAARDKNQSSRDPQTADSDDAQPNEQGAEPAPEEVGPPEPRDAATDAAAQKDSQPAEASGEPDSTAAPNEQSSGDRGQQDAQDEQNQAEQKAQQQGEQQQGGESSSDSSQSSGQSGRQPSGEQQSGNKQSGKQQAGQQGQESGQQSTDQSGQGKPSSGDDNSGKSSSGAKSDQSGDQQEQGAQDSVASDGSNDGDAIERILQHREQQEQGDKQPGDQQAARQADGQSSKPSGNDQPREANREQSASSNQQSGKSSDDKQRDSQSKSQGKPPSGSKSSDASAKGGDRDSQSESPGDRSSTKAGQSSQVQDPQNKGSQEKSDEQSGDRKDKPSQSENSQGDQAKGDQKEQSEGPSGEKDSQQSPSKSDQSNSEQGQSDSKGDQNSQDGQQPNANDRQLGDSSQGSKPSDGQAEQRPEKSDPRSGATQDNNTRQDGDSQQPETTGQGAQSKDDPQQSGKQQAEQSAEQRPDARGGDGEQSKGNSGAGQKTNENAGSPKPQDSNQPRDKSQQQGNQQSEQKRDGQEQSPSNSKKESDSQGDEDGDRSGGGKRGGGQKANQAGTGGAGQNTAADEGAGQSEQSGDGETSDRAGGDKQSSEATGQKGSQAGQGSRQSSTGEGEQQSSGNSAGEQSAPMGDQPGNSQGGAAQGGDQPGAQKPQGAAGSEQTFQPGTDSADAANLEYSRKATDLALEHLKHQLDDSSADPELLKRLGWTRQEAEEFVRRWETLRSSASAPDQRGQAGRRELDDTLRSLGLRPRGSKLSANAARDDRSQGLKESRRTTPPAEYSEAFKAYTQGTARGGK